MSRFFPGDEVYFLDTSYNNGAFKVRTVKVLSKEDPDGSYEIEMPGITGYKAPGYVLYGFEDKAQKRADELNAGAPLTNDEQSWFGECEEVGPGFTFKDEENRMPWGSYIRSLTTKDVKDKLQRIQDCVFEELRGGLFTTSTKLYLDICLDIRMVNLDLFSNH